MHTLFSNAKVLVESAHFITATLFTDRNVNVIGVYVSTLVHMTDPLYMKVMDAVHAQCSLKVHESVEQDDMMMFGSATALLYEVYSRCPGDEVFHTCVGMGGSIAGRGQEALSLSKSV